MKRCVDLLGRGAACVAVAVCASPALSTLEPFRVVARSGAAAPGVPGGQFSNVFRLTSGPSEVGLLLARLAPESTAPSGIWRLNRATGEASLVSLSLDGFPPPGEVYHVFDDHTIAQDGRVYFGGRRRVPNSSSAQFGLFTSASGTAITPVILQGTQVIGGQLGEAWSGTISLSEPDNSGRMLVVAGTSNGSRLVSVTNGGTPSMILRVGQTFPGTSTVVTAFGSPANSASGRFTFVANAPNSPFNTALWTGTSATDIQPVVLPGAAAPGIASATFDLARPSMIAPNGTIAVEASYRIGNVTRVGMWVRGSDGQLTLVARPGMAIAGEPGNDVQIIMGLESVNNSGSTVFSGFGTASGQGLFITSPAGIVRIATRDETAPGGGIFGGSGGPAVINNAGTVAFEWQLEGDVFGNGTVFAYRPETGTVRVIGPSDTVMIAGAPRTVLRASMLSPSGSLGGLSDNNELFVRVVFTDSSSAILATFVPTPSATTTLAGGMLLAMRRRRSARS